MLLLCMRLRRVEILRFISSAENVGSAYIEQVGNLIGLCDIIGAETCIVLCEESWTRLRSVSPLGALLVRRVIPPKGHCSE